MTELNDVEMADIRFAGFEAFEVDLILAYGKFGDDIHVGCGKTAEIAIGNLFSNALAPKKDMRLSPGAAMHAPSIFRAVDDIRRGL